MKICCICFISVILSFKAVSQNKYDAILKKDYPQKLTLLDSIGGYIIGNDVDSALALRRLDTLQREVSKAGDAKAMAYVKYLRYAFAVMRQHADSLSSEQMKAEVISMADHEDFPAVKAFAYIRQGYFYQNMKGGEVNAFENFLKAFDIYGKLSNEEFPGRLYSLYSLANTYYKAYAPEEAKEYAMMVVNDKKDDNLTKMFTWCLLGVVYKDQHIFDSALYCQQQAYRFAEKRRDKYWMANSLYNIAAHYSTLKKTRESLDALQQSRDLFRQIPSEAAAADDEYTLMLLAKDYVDLNKTDSAAPVIDKLQLMVRNNQQTPSYYMAYYTMLAKYYKATGNFTEASAAIDSVVKNNDRFLQNQLFQKKPKIEVKMAEEKRAYAEALAMKQKTINNWIIVSGLLLLGFMFMLYNRFRLTTRMKQKQLLAENKLAKEQLENNNKLLLGYLQNITEKNELIEKIMAELETLKSKEGDDKKQTDEIIEKLRNTVILTEDHWKEFQGLYGKVYQDFSDRLLTKAPDLTSAEMRYIMLDNLGLSSKDMARTLGVGHEAIRQTRFRLKKKLSLQENETLEDWMKTFKEEIMPSQN